MGVPPDPNSSKIESLFQPFLLKTIFFEIFENFPTNKIFWNLFLWSNPKPWVKMGKNHILGKGFFSFFHDQNN